MGYGSVGSGVLAAAGVGSMLVGGHLVTQLWLVVVAAGLVGGGVLLARFGFRRGRSPEEL